MTSKVIARECSYCKQIFAPRSKKQRFCSGHCWSKYRWQTSLHPCRESVIQIRQANPCATLQDIGNKVGITRERVRQILQTAQLDTYHYRPTYICNQCGEPISRERATKNKLYCSSDCLKQSSRITLPCSYCGTLVTRKVSDFICHKKNHVFCNRHCFGKWWNVRLREIRAMKERKSRN